MDQYALYVAKEEIIVKVFRHKKELCHFLCKSQEHANVVEEVVAAFNDLFFQNEKMVIKTETRLVRAEEIPALPLDSEQVKTEQQKAKEEQRKTAINTNKVLEEIKSKKPKDIDSLFS